MAKREYFGQLPSLEIDEAFLKDLFKIVNGFYGRGNRSIPQTTSITIESDKESITYDQLPDLLNSQVHPKRIDALTVKKKSTNRKDEKKVIQFYLKLDEEDSGGSYYKLISYDDGMLKSCQEKIESLLDRNKKWYWFIFKETTDSPEDGNLKGMPAIFGLFLIISASTLIHQLFLSFGFDSDISLVFAVIGFFVVYKYLAKFADEFLPYMDWRIQRRKRSIFAEGIFWTVIVALAANILWECFKFLFQLL